MSPAQQRVAVLGGSFNPPHLGHQMICLYALSTGRADRVWFVPTYCHAFHKTLAPFAQRAEMCRLAQQTMPAKRTEVCEVEETIGGESRTLTTLRFLIAQHPQKRFSLLIGADLREELPVWHGIEEIRQLAEFIVVGREGHAGPQDVVTLPNISSSAIRQRLIEGQDVSDLVPAAVLSYIKTHGLYLPEATQAPAKTE